MNGAPGATGLAPWRRCRSKVVRVVLLTIGIAGAVVFWQCSQWQHSATLTFQRHSEYLQSRKSVMAPREIRRPARIAPSREGEAWDFYAPALLNARTFPGGWAWIPTIDEHRRLVLQCQPILQNLRSAQSVNTLTFPLAAGSQAASELDLLGGIHGLSYILLRVARGFHAQQKDRECFDILALLLGTCSDMRRDTQSGLIGAQWSLDIELQGMEGLRQLFGEYSLSPPDLDYLSSIVRFLRVSRSALHGNISAQGPFWRSQILDQERQGDSLSPFSRSATWRFAFSARLERASTLDTLERVWERLRALENAPPSRWLGEVDAITREDGSESIPVGTIRRAYECELDALREWELLTIALGIARFQAKEGTPPASLQVLPHDILDSLPQCPHGAEQFLYRIDEVWCAEKPNHKWVVAQRKSEAHK